MTGVATLVRTTSKCKDRIYTPIFLNDRRGACGAQNSEINRIQDSFVLETKIVRRQNTSKSFGYQTGQNSHMPVLSTTSTRFEYVPYKNKSCVFKPITWYGLPIYSTPSEALPLSRWVWPPTLSFSVLPSEWCTSPDNSTASDSQLEKKEELTTSTTTFIAIMKLVHLPSFNRLNFPWTSASRHIYTHSASRRTNTSLCTF